jgi:cytochrome c biogenesis protein CcdA
VQEWISEVLEAGQFGWLMLAASFLLGLLTAVGSACNIAVIGAVASYAASRKEKSRIGSLLACVGFMLAVVISLTAAGTLIGSVKGLSRYGTIFAGFITIVFGLAALGIAPLRLRRLGVLRDKRPDGMLSSAVLGLAVGGASTACTLACCAPLLWVALGIVAAQGRAGLGALILSTFAVGFSIPMTAVMMGINLGKLSTWGERFSGGLRVLGGILLIGIGFWLLASA